MFKVILTLNIKALLPVWVVLFYSYVIVLPAPHELQFSCPVQEQREGDGEERLREHTRPIQREERRAERAKKSQCLTTSSTMWNGFFFRFSFHIRWRGSSNKDIVEILVIIKSCHLSIRTTLSTTVRRAKKPNVERMRMGPVSVCFLSLKGSERALSQTRTT